MGAVELSKAHIDTINKIAGREIVSDTLVGGELYIQENENGSYEAHITSYADSCIGTLLMSIGSTGEINSQRGCALWIDDYHKYATCTCYPIFNEGVIDSVDAKLIIGMLKSLKIDLDAL